MKSNDTDTHTFTITIPTLATQNVNFTSLSFNWGEVGPDTLPPIWSISSNRGGGSTITPSSATSADNSSNFSNLTLAGYTGLNNTTVTFTLLDTSLGNNLNTTMYTWFDNVTLTGSLVNKADQSITGIVNLGRRLSGSTLTGVTLGTLNNAAISGSTPLTVALSSTGPSGGSISGLASSTGSTVGSTLSGTITGNVNVGTTLGAQTYSLTNTDAAAVTTAASNSGGAVTVVASRLVTNATTLNLGVLHSGASISTTSNATGNTYGTGGTGAQADTENATVSAFSGVQNGITLTTGATSLTTNAGVSGSLTGTISGTGTVNGTYTLSATRELSGSQAGPTIGYTASVFNGNAVWTGTGSSWGSGASTTWVDSNSINAAPGTFVGFGGVDSATFDNSGIANLTVSLNGTNPSLNALTFNSASSYTVDATGGGTLTMAGTTPTITTTTGTHTISAVIAGSADLTKAGAGTLELTGVNTYTGATHISAGILQLSGSGSINNSTVTIASGGALATSVNTVIDANVNYNASASSTIAGAITGATNTVTVNNVATTLTLSGMNTYGGATTVSAGKLIVNGSVSTSITTVQNGATLGGTGTVGTLTIEAGGFHAPGNSPGIQPVGNYTQNGTLAMEINGLTAGTQHDRVDVTGTVDITGSTLSLTSMGYTAANSDLIFILLNDSSDAITGTFAGLAEGASVGSIGGKLFNITYFANGDSMGSPSFTGGNDIALMAVPEPSTALLGAIGLLALLRRRR